MMFVDEGRISLLRGLWGMCGAVEGAVGELYVCMLWSDVAGTRRDERWIKGVRDAQSAGRFQIAPSRDLGNW